MPLETPVLFCVFNRPDLTRRVFDRIAEQQPKTLLIACDGPRIDHQDDQRLVQQTRAIFQQVDWPCRVEQYFRPTNCGCRQQMADSISWAFKRHERLIILEDDCLPSPSFFPFCEELLERYADDERVMMVSGDNFQPTARSRNSYYFSKYSHIWGWASWRRAWNHFDLGMSSWPDYRRRASLAEFCCGDQELEYWKDTFDRQHAGEIDTWDYSWAYACWQQNGLTILPEANLVSNIGFRSDGTHTTDAGSRLANQPVTPIEKITHPSVVARDCVADEYTWRTVFRPPVNDRQSKRDKRRTSKSKSHWLGRRAA